MDDKAHTFLIRLLETPSPSGYEAPVQDVVREYVASFADEVRTDVHGNVIASCNAGGSLRLLYAGHCDQIGLLVSYIDDNGYLYSQTIGGWDPQQLIGQRMTVWTDRGPVPAVIARKPIHLLDQEERKKVVEAKQLWLDIGAASKEEAAEVVRIGDAATLQLGYQELRNGFANAPGMDDKTGLWVVIEALRRASEDGGLECSLHAVSTVQEEIGLRGARTSAFGVDPHVGVAVDVTHATDCPTIDKNQQGDVRLGQGPVISRGPNMNEVVTRRLMATAEEAGIPYQVTAIGRATPNDANSIQINRAGVATGLVGIPNRYMHSAVETVALEDLDHAADLLARFALDLRADDDFTPGR
ncbi:MAG TPA: M42 family metallopeptidase [Thermoanaerobaculia bacterium]|nr:M42 family metallopeptidase [Thermoanaerobaculia bacterium]